MTYQQPVNLQTVLNQDQVTLLTAHEHTLFAVFGFEEYTRLLSIVNPVTHYASFLLVLSRAPPRNT